MKTIEDLKAAVDPIPAMMSAKGLREPCAEITMQVHGEFYLYIRWKEENPITGLDTQSKFFFGDAADKVIVGAIDYINALPSAHETKLSQFMKQLGRVIDAGRDNGINVDFLNPLTDTMKRLSENIITYQPKAGDGVAA